MKQSYKDMNAKLTKVEAREHARLIRIAQKSGFLDIKLTTSEIEAVFDAFMKSTDKKRLSQLKKLRLTLKRTQSAEKKTARRASERKKILLGSFFVAQARHKHKFVPGVRKQLMAFLEADKNAARVMRNKALLSVFLIDPKDTTNVQKIPTVKEKTQTHMHIVLGSYLEWAFAQDPEFLDSQRQEIARFLDATYTKATGAEKRQLLNAYLPIHQKGAD